MGTKTIEMLPPEVIQLQKELAEHHPTLCRVLALVDDPDGSERLAMIATHCDVKVDGDYTAKQIIHVCEKLTEILATRREV